MEAESFNQTVRSLAHRVPFRPFVVELVSGAQITVDHPEALVVRAGLAAYIDPTGIPMIFDHEGVSRLMGAPSETSTAQAA